MKKVILIFLFPIVISSSDSKAQFYISFGAGNNYQFLSQPIFTNYVFPVSGTSTNFDISNKIENSSYGAGISFKFSFGYKINDNVSTELEFSIINSKTFSYDSTWINNTSFQGKPLAIEDAEESQFSATMTRMTPILKISFSPTRFSPYIKLGAVIKIGASLTNNNSLSDNYPGYDQSGSSSTIYSGGLSIGFLFDGGVEYKLEDYFSAFAEFVMIYQEWTPVNYQNENGGFNSIATAQNYEVYSYPFSSFGFNLGLKYTFLKNK
jgi:hypothetical protein